MDNPEHPNPSFKVREHQPSTGTSSGSGDSDKKVTPAQLTKDQLLKAIEAVKNAGNSPKKPAV